MTLRPAWPISESLNLRAQPSIKLSYYNVLESNKPKQQSGLGWWRQDPALHVISATIHSSLNNLHHGSWHPSLQQLSYDFAAAFMWNANRRRGRRKAYKPLFLHILIHTAPHEWQRGKIQVLQESWRNIFHHCFLLYRITICWQQSVIIWRYFSYKSLKGRKVENSSNPK